MWLPVPSDEVTIISPVRDDLTDENWSTTEQQQVLKSGVLIHPQMFSIFSLHWQGELEQKFVSLETDLLFECNNHH